MWLQAAALASSLAAIGLTGTALGVLTPLVLVALWWAWLDHWYARQLAGAERSSWRQGSDHHVTRQLAAIAGAGVVSVVLTKTVPALPLEASRSIRWALFAFMALWFCVYASSLVDWYWIRPQVDGVVTEPPCRTSQQPRWQQVTRGWHGHRAFAHIAVCFAVVVGLTAIIAAAVPDIDGAALAACAAALAAVAVSIVLPAFFALWRAIDGPGIWVGDRVTTKDGRGYVLHITMDKLVLRFRNGSNASWGRPKSVSPEAVEGTPIPFSGCGACSHVNPQCDWDAQRLNAGNSSHPFRL